MVSSDGGEDLQNPFGRWGRAVAELEVERNVVQCRSAHGGADLAFDEGADEQGEELAAEQGFDPGRVVQQHRGGVLDAFEQVVAAFQVRLVAVGGQDFGVAQVAVVAGQRKAAVAGGVVGDAVEFDVGVDGEVAGEDLAVARLGSGPAGVGLLVGLGDGLADGERGPLLGVGCCECGGGLLDGDPGLDRLEDLNVRGYEFGTYRTRADSAVERSSCRRRSTASSANEAKPDCAPLLLQPLAVESVDRYDYLHTVSKGGEHNGDPRDNTADDFDTQAGCRVRHVAGGVLSRHPRG